VPDLLAYAREQQAIVRRIAAWYDGLEILIPTYFVLLRGPLLGIPAVGAVQPFAAGKQRDVFRDLPVSRLVQILRSRRRLREQFLGFVARTLRVVREEQVCVDLLGYRNLVLIDEADGRLLLIDDDSLYDMGDKSTRSPAALTELNRRLDYLTAVVRMLQSDGSSSPIGAADLVP
jgi:hypothetical protein